jgi:hypothetical protein
MLCWSVRGSLDWGCSSCQLDRGGPVGGDSSVGHYVHICRYVLVAQRSARRRQLAVRKPIGSCNCGFVQILVHARLALVQSHPSNPFEVAD